MNMKCALIALLVIASTGTNVALAQEGMGHGPPSTPTTPASVPTPTTLPTSPSSTGTPKSAAAHVGASVDELGPVISSARESRKRGSRPA
jgi:hypothetical protein